MSENKMRGGGVEKVRTLEYDLSAISVKELVSSLGFKVQVAYYTYILTKYAEHLPDLLEDIEEIMGKKKFGIASPEERSVFYLSAMAESSELERGRLNYGIQVARNIGASVKNVAGIRVIGAESKLKGRSEKRGINDLDLAVDFLNRPTESEVSLILNIAKGAEKKTGIRIDLLGVGIPVTASSAEHVFAIFDDPLPIRGFPVYWRDERYLESLLEMKKDHYDKGMVIRLKAEDELKRAGLRVQRIS